MDAKKLCVIGLGLQWQNRLILHNQLIIIDQVKQNKE